MLIYSYGLDVLCIWNFVWIVLKVTTERNCWREAVLWNEIWFYKSKTLVSIASGAWSERHLEHERITYREQLQRIGKYILINCKWTWLFQTWLSLLFQLSDCQYQYNLFFLHRSRNWQIIFVSIQCYFALAATTLSFSTWAASWWLSLFLHFPFKPIENFVPFFISFTSTHFWRNHLHSRRLSFAAIYASDWLNSGRKNMLLTRSMPSTWNGKYIWSRVGIAKKVGPEVSPHPNSRKQEATMYTTWVFSRFCRPSKRNICFKCRNLKKKVQKVQIAMSRYVLCSQKDKCGVGRFTLRTCREKSVCWIIYQNELHAKDIAFMWK